MNPFSVPAPAKVNLFLAVTRRRTDGFHDLVSLAAPLDWGDTLEVSEGNGAVSVSADWPDVPSGPENLVVKAAAAFAEATGWDQGASFRIAKRIPVGAGLGGASSDAAAALKALNQLSGGALGAAALSRAASSVGSDCALFLAGGPVVMRGRGELIEAVPAAVRARVSGLRILLFKPAFAISTPWAYARLVEGAPASYCDPRWAEARLSAWMDSAEAHLGELLFNSMDAPAFSKYPALSLVLEQVRGRFGVAAGMTGSGSACFALLEESTDAAPIEAALREALGPSAFTAEARIA